MTRIAVTTNISYTGAIENERRLPVVAGDLMVDKDLPAIPNSEYEGQDEAGPSSQPPIDDRNKNPPGASGSSPRPSFPSPGRQAIPKPSPTPPHLSPASALARAALGVSLSHTMLPLSRDRHVNDPPIVTPNVHSDPPSPVSRQGAPETRPQARTYADSPPAHAPTRRKSRPTLLSFPRISSSKHAQEEVKGKEVEPMSNDTEDAAEETKVLTRRASFWSRRRQRSLVEPSDAKAPTAPSAPNTLHPHIPSLPSLKPVSPLFFDTHLTTSPGAATPDNNALRRRHSERSPPSSSGSFLLDTLPSSASQAPPRPVRSPRRPSTQDGRVQSGYFTDTATRRPATSHGSSPHVPFSAMHSDRSDTASRVGQSSRSFSFSNSPRLSLRLSSSSLSSSATSSPRTPVSNIHTRLTPSSQSVITNPIPKPRLSEESPEIFVSRLEGAVSKAEIATILASSADTFYANALQVYIDQFDFTDQPLDIALRKLLVDVGLPKETQQIDRVMEAFAKKYTTCNPGLFTSDDHPYILAFSMIMLHTDAFNKSNKRKMTKPDYVKNVKPLGIAEEVLDYFYDNIVYTPFIFIEDPLDINGQRGLRPDGHALPLQSANSQSSTNSNASTTSLLSRNNKLDPYYMMSRNLLSSLRVEVEGYVPSQNPYSYQGPSGSWKEEDLHRAFALADVIEGGSWENWRLSSLPLFALNVAGSPGPGAFGSYVGDLTDFVSSDGGAEPGTAMLKMAKVGLLERKDDLLDGGRKANGRKWKPWSVVLTGSQLLFFKDLELARNLSGQTATSGGQILLPHISMLKFDELQSVKDVIAVHDATYTKHRNTLRVVMPNGRQFLLQADNELERDGWIAHINYSSAFKTAGIRMRAMSMSDKDVDWTGVAAAASHLQRKRLRPSVPPVVHTFVSSDVGASDETAVLTNSPTSMAFPEPRRSRADSYKVPDRIDLEGPVSPISASSQLKSVFDFVKGELASGRALYEQPNTLSSEDLSALDLGTTIPSSLILNSPDSGCSASIHSRSEVIRNKIHDLEAKINVLQIQLDSDLRYVRHLSVLTPFQKSTQDRIQAAVISYAKKIVQVRLEMVKMICHRDVLNGDLDAEEKDYQRSKFRALRAATDFLHVQHNTDSAVPKLTLNA